MKKRYKILIGILCLIVVWIGSAIITGNDIWYMLGYIAGTIYGWVGKRAFVLFLVIILTIVLRSIIKKKKKKKKV